MTKFAPLGSVSHGTMRPEDLIPRFMEVLEEIREEIAAPGPTTEDPSVTNSRKATVARLDKFLGEIEERMEDDRYYDSESCEWDLEALFDALNDHAPAGHYFGAHPGDGADYGFWALDE